MPGVLQFFDTKECEWSDQELAISGVTCGKATGVKWGVKHPKSYLHAGGKKPLSIQGHNKEYPGELRILLGALLDLNAAAILAGGDDITDTEFDITITYIAKGTRGRRTVVYPQCQVDEFEAGWAQGDPKMEITLPFKGMQPRFV
jgi:hypothetical protein